MQHKILSGDRSAFKQFYQRTHKAFFLICQRYARTSEEAKDLLQESYVSIFKDMEKYDSTKALLKTWSSRVVINTCLQQLRRHNIFGQVVSDLSQASHFLTHQPAEFETLSMKELLGLIQLLPNGCRSVFNLYVIDGYNHKEIADILGISQSTSKTQLMKARKMLKGKVKNYSPELLQGYA